MEKRHIKAILFDLDKTLYDPDVGLQEAGDRLITEWIADTLQISEGEANEIRLRTWREYGTTTAGMMAEYDISGREFCDGTVNRLDPKNFLEPRPRLARMLSQLPAECYVFTNAPDDYARRVLEALDISMHFQRIFGMEYCDWVCKPQIELYEAVLDELHLAGGRVVFIDDDAMNLSAAKQVGMVTVLCGEDEHGNEDYDFRIDRILDLRDALRKAGVIS